MMRRRKTNRPSSTAPAAGTAKPKRTRADKAIAKRLMSLLKAGNDTRVAKVKRIRSSVRTKIYENDLKLSIAIERLSRELSA